MENLKSLMSSAKGDWQTPDVILDLVRELGPIDLDPCTTPDNPTGARLICVPEKPVGGLLAHQFLDGLEQDWRSLTQGLVYCNPPYGREISYWTQKCREFVHIDGEAEAVGLFPARTDTKWWHRDCVPPCSNAVCFLKGRLKFVGAKASAPFPSALVYWGIRANAFREIVKSKGAVWLL